MKKIMKKWMSILTAAVLVLALLTTAMADTLYTTDGFTIPSERIGGVRVPIEEPITEDEPVETTPTEPENNEPVEPRETESEEALDEQNVEGLIVVDGEEKTEDEIISEQTEVRTDIAEENTETTVTDETEEEKTPESEDQIIEENGNDTDIDNEGSVDETVAEDTETLTEEAEGTEDTEEQISEDEEPEQYYIEETEDNTITILTEEDNATEVFEEEPVELKVTYEKDENGNILLDAHGDPIPIVPEGMGIPVRFQKDENGNLVLDENGEPIVLETIAYGSQRMMDIEDLLDPNRSISVYFNYGGDRDYALLGDTIEFIAVLKGYDNAIYTLQWQYSLDEENWMDYPGGTEKTMFVTMDEVNCEYWWRVHLDIEDVIPEIVQE